ncbi:MAG: hypothetical protein V4773_19470 [Verrucomicrobiota bacterium]
MKQTHGARVLLLLAVAAVSGGCASSQMNRIDRNRDIYEQWPLETRQAVLDGKVEAGMTPDMVRVAWGEPSEVVTQSKTGDEIWVFKRGGNDGSVYYPGGGMGSNTGGVYSGGPGIGISTSNRGGTAIGATGGIGIGGGTMGGIGGGGMGTPIVTPPTPPEVREVVFRGGVVAKADRPFNEK